MGNIPRFSKKKRNSGGPAQKRLTIGGSSFKVKEKLRKRGKRKVKLQEFDLK